MNDFNWPRQKDPRRQFEHSLVNDKILPKPPKYSVAQLRANNASNEEAVSSNPGGAVSIFSLQYIKWVFEAN